MNVTIDSSKCQGHGSCAVICGGVFDLDDDGYGTVVEPHPEASLHASVRDAVDNCPEQAITATED